MIDEYVKFALRTFRARKLRSWLTMLGIFIGIAAVVSLISLGQGLQLAVTQAFQDMGTDKIIIMPGSSLMSFGSSLTNELTDDDIDAIKRVKGIKYVSGWLYKIGQVEYNDKIIYTWVMGLPVDTESKRLVESIQSMELDLGRELKQGDKYKAQIGYLLANEDAEFGKRVGVGETIKIEAQEFKVVGSLERIGTPDDDTSVLVPLDTAREILDEPDEYTMIFAQVQPGADMDKVADNIEEELRDSRDLDEGEEDFSVQTAEEMMRSYGMILTIIQAVIIGIAAISLIVGGIGIMNTMYTSVLERTPEIGIMKAIGAKNRDVMAIFMIESGLLGLAGGAVGVVLGMSFSKLVEFGAATANMPILKASFPWYLTVGALAFSFIVGTLFGTLPAIQASRQKPVDALRYE